MGARTGERDIVFDFLITQDQLADATGMTGVHVNRMLKSLRADGLVDWRGGRGVVRIPDWDKLVAAGEFDAAYLSLVKPEQRIRIVQAS